MSESLSNAIYICAAVPIVFALASFGFYAGIIAASRAFGAIQVTWKPDTIHIVNHKPPEPR